MGQKQVPGELLGDRAAAFDDLAGLKVVYRGTSDSEQIYAPVASKPPVLRGYDGVNEDLGYLLQGNRGAVLRE